jgi:hypothetical protein
MNEGENPEDAVARGARAMKTLLENMPMLLDGARVEAKINAERYRNYIANGFTKEQAVELVKAHIQRGMV